MSGYPFFFEIAFVSTDFPPLCLISRSSLFTQFLPCLDSRKQEAEHSNQAPRANSARLKLFLCIHSTGPIKLHCISPKFVHPKGSL